MSFTTKASLSMTLALALALARMAPCGPPETPPENAAGPVLVLPSPGFGNRLIPENLISDLTPRASEPNVFQQPEQAAEAAEAGDDGMDREAPAGPDEVGESRHGANEDASEVAEPEKPRRQLSPGMTTLRDQVRRTLAAHRGQVLSTAENTVTEVIYACRAFGCNTEVLEAVSLRQRINGVTCLLWNYPAAGFTPLTISDGHITGRIGYGYQEHPGELIATLALAQVPADYPVRVGKDVRTVADLVEYEKLACRAGTDKSLAMIGLMHYAGSEPAWRNRLGERWSIERIVEEELDKPVVGAPRGGTQRLMGLSYVVRRRARRNQPLDGPYRRAHDYLLRFHDHALALQNDDGSWNRHYLGAKGNNSSPGAGLASTGRILEWLAFSLPEERLNEPGVVRAVHFVNRALRSGRYGPQNVRSLRTEEIGAAMHALAALRHYDERFFRPFDPPPADPGRVGGAGRGTGTNLQVNANRARPQAP